MPADEKALVIRRSFYSARRLFLPLIHLSEVSKIPEENSYTNAGPLTGFPPALLAVETPNPERPLREKQKNKNKNTRGKVRRRRKSSQVSRGRKSSVAVMRAR